MTNLFIIISPQTSNEKYLDIIGSFAYVNKWTHSDGINTYMYINVWVLISFLLHFLAMFLPFLLVASLTIYAVTDTATEMVITLAHLDTYRKRLKNESNIKVVLPAAIRQVVVCATKIANI